MFFSMLLIPESYNQTKEAVEIHYFDKNTLSDCYKKQRDSNVKNWKKVFSEDIEIVEAMQKGRHAEAFDGGLLTPYMDGPTKIFHAWARKELGIMHE